MDAVFYRPGEGEAHAVGASLITIKAAGEHTGGTFFLSESVIEPGFGGPPPHVHHQLHDMFYVLEGTLVLRLGDELLSAQPSRAQRVQAVRRWRPRRTWRWQMRPGLS